MLESCFRSFAVNFHFRLMTQTHLEEIPYGRAAGIVSIMATRRSAETTPDLFSAAPTTKALERRAVPEGKAQPNRSTSQSNYFLPKDLAGALKRLDNLEIDALLAAVTNEAERFQYQTIAV